MGNIWCVGQQINYTVSNSATTTSEDGVTWANSETFSNPFPELEMPSTLNWYGNLLIAGSTGGSVSVTSNYHTWQTGLMATGVRGFAITGMVAPPSYIICGRRHYLSSGNGFPPNTEVAQIFRSATGYPGTYSLLFSTGDIPSGFNGIKYFPDADIGTGALAPVIVVVGDHFGKPYALYSINGGNTWTQISIDSDFVGSFYDVEYDPNSKKWYFGALGAIAIATNLTSPTWTTSTSFGTKLSEVTKLKINPEGSMVAVTPSAIWWSENLENWNKVEIQGYNWQSVTWYDNKWIVGAYSLLTQYSIWYSSDMRTWLPDNNGIFPTAFAISTQQAVRYWMNILGGPDNDNGLSLSVDSSGNNYFVGYTDPGLGTNDCSIASYDALGNLKWQKALGGNSSDIFYGITLDNTGNLFAIGSTQSSSVGQSDILISKYNITGTLLWQKTLGLSNVDVGTGVSFLNQNIYIAGTTTNNTGQYGSVAKLTQDGSIIWQNQIGNGNATAFTGIIASQFDSNVYCCGTNNSNILVSSFTTDGTQNWNLELYSDGIDNATGITLDNTGANIILCGSTFYNNVNSNVNAFISKVSTSSDLQWQTILKGNGVDTWNGVTRDTDNNMYLTGSTNSFGSGGNDILLAKYDLNGNLLWQRTLGGTGNNDVGYKIGLDGDTNMYIASTTNSRSGSNKALITKLPSNGSLTGAYSEFVYRVSNLIPETSTLTVSPITLSVTPSLLVSNVSNLTGYNTTFTNITYILD